MSTHDILLTNRWKNNLSFTALCYRKCYYMYTTAFAAVFAFLGESGTFRGEHSVEDHYLHINGIIFWGGVANFFGGRPPQNRSPGSPETVGMFYL